ncbi:hypothetical protein [Aneurinibacillus thermoaerophilus]|uniref:hypothetical protein n=1 Tax=Aneurinibacillus thermoaerophilus TaxID=143495 RepID=UPI002E1C44E7|nr:hypothetical protein [Aneurinibacillus thermoaerophilus]
MKKIATITILSFSLLTLSACGEKESSSSTAASSTSQDEIANQTVKGQRVETKTPEEMEREAQEKNALLLPAEAFGQATHYLAQMIGAARILGVQASLKKEDSSEAVEAKKEYDQAVKNYQALVQKYGEKRIRASSLNPDVPVDYKQHDEYRMFCRCN